MKKFCTYFNILTLAAMLMVGVDNAWGVEYIVNDGNVYTRSSWSGAGVVATYTWNVAQKTNGKVSFQAKTSMATTTNAKTITLQETTDGKTWSNVQNFTITSSFATYSCTKLSINAQGVRFNVGGAYDRSVKDVKVEYGVFIGEPSLSSLDFGNGINVGSDPVVRSFTVDWCNVAALTASLQNESQYSVSINNNASVGNYGTATIYVTYNHTAAGTHNESLSLTSTNYNKVITLSGSAISIEEPTYTCKLASTYYVGDQIDLNDLWTSTSDAAKKYEIVSFSPSSAINEGATEPSILGSVLTVGKAGKLKLKLSQDATANYYAGSAEKEITISKRPNPITITMNDVERNELTMARSEQANVSWVSDSQSDFVVSGGNEIVSREGNIFTSNYRNGSATWTVSQAENYKYEAGSATFTIKVADAAAGDCYVKDLGTTQLEAKLGGSTPKYTWTDQNAAGVLSYQVVGKPTSVGNSVQAYQCVDGSWSKVGASYDGYSNSVYTSNSVTLDPRATGFYFTVAGSYSSTIKDIRVTRKTYLNTADVAITKTESSNDIHLSETGVGMLSINRSLASGGDLHVVWDNDKFTIDGKTAAEGVNLGNFDCSTGVTNLPITYVSNEAGTHTAHVTIYNKVYSTTATITGATVKREQQIVWDLDDILPVGARIENAATSEHSTVVLTSGKPAVATIENGVLVAVAPGTVTITATASETPEYAQKVETRAITVTDRKVQDIVWNQLLMNLTIGGANVTLNAYATSEVDGCTTNSARSITYTSADESVVRIVNNNQLQIVGKGTTTVTATQAGGEDADGHDYVAVSQEKKVIVRDPNEVCEAFVFEQGDHYRMDCGWNAANKQNKNYEIDFQGQEPGYYNFDYKGEAQKVAIEYYDGTMTVQQYVNGAWVEVQNLGKPTKGQYRNTGNVALDRRATKMRVMVTGGLGYHYVNNCQVTLARYIEAETPSVFEAKVGERQQKTIALRYSNIQGALTLGLGSSTSHFSIEPVSVDGACGDKGVEQIQVAYTPTVATVSTETELLTISDGKTTTTVMLYGNSTLTDRHIEWNIPAEQSVYTVETITMDAVAKTGLGSAAGSVYYSVVSPSTTGTISANTLSFASAGTAYVAAQTVHDARYEDAVAVTKRFNVSLTPTTVTTLPAIVGDVYLNTLSSALSIEGGAVENTITHAVVAGTFSVKNVATLTQLGQRQITLVFTPANTDMYLPCECDVTVDVLRRQFAYEEAGAWTEDANWSSDLLPTADDDVTINADVTISTDVTVHSLTIAPEASVTLTVNGSLTVLNGSTDQASYGNLIVEDGGRMTLGDGEMHVHNFYLEATGGDKQHEATSGEVYHVENLAIDGDVYFDLLLDPSGTCTEGWYMFTVPFCVNVNTGISRIEEDGVAHHVAHLTRFAIKEYREDMRANGQNDWQFVSNNAVTPNILQPGVLYAIKVLDPYAHYRFRKESGAAFNTATTRTLTYTEGSADVTNRGWNGIGNGLLTHATMAVDGITKAQFFNHDDDSYTLVEISDATEFVVGSAYFVQAACVGEAVYTSAAESVVSAPTRMAEQNGTEFVVTLTAEDADRVSDRLYLSATETAMPDYQIGHDLIKMGVTTRSAQLYARGYGRSLCDIESPLVAGRALVPITVYAPEQGAYVLSQEREVQGQSLYLVQHGRVIWNLSMSEYYLDLQAGDHTDYSLLLVQNAPAVTTDVEDAVWSSDIDKFILDGRLYIQRDGRLYDAEGRVVR